MQYVPRWYSRLKGLAKDALLCSPLCTVDSSISPLPSGVSSPLLKGTPPFEGTAVCLPAPNTACAATVFGTSSVLPRCFAPRGHTGASELGGGRRMSKGGVLGRTECGEPETLEDLPRFTSLLRRQLVPPRSEGLEPAPVYDAR